MDKNYIILLFDGHSSIKISQIYILNILNNIIKFVVPYYENKKIIKDAISKDKNLEVYSLEIEEGYIFPYINYEMRLIENSQQNNIIIEKELFDIFLTKTNESVPTTSLI
jgi:hypothetical protein